jgi:hypothetical protein
MTIQIAIQILLTVLITGGCTFLATSFVSITKDKVKLQKWFAFTAKCMWLIHFVALPAAIINLIWSF